MEMRGVNRELLAAVEEKRDAVRDAYRIAGIELSRDLAGRLRANRQQRLRAEREKAKRWARRRVRRELDRQIAVLEEEHEPFEGLLARIGARIPPGSPLEAALLLTTQVGYMRGENAPLQHLQGVAEDNMWRRGGWLRTMIPKILAAESHPDFPQLVPHLRLVVHGELALSVPGPREE
jgi:hypothetical protein